MWPAISAEPAVPAEDGSPAPGRWRREILQCQRPGPAGIWQLCTGLRQIWSQGGLAATGGSSEGAGVADSCPRKGGSEGARVSMSAETIPACWNRSRRSRFRLTQRVRRERRPRADHDRHRRRRWRPWSDKPPKRCRSGRSPNVYQTRRSSTERSFPPAS